MQRHIRAQHSNDIIIINEEGILPQCHNCGIFQYNAKTEQHMVTTKCKQYTEIKRKRRQEIIQNAATYVRFHINNQQEK
jgi:acetyl-CoA carboxylase beta subunit